MSVSRPNVELHIEELVLHGVPPGSRHRLAEAVERELTQLLTDRGLPPLAADVDVPRLDGGAFSLTSGLPAEAVGSRIATAVHGGLTR